MKSLLLIALFFNLSFASVVDDYLNSLKQEVLKENPSFKNFDALRGEEIFTSNYCSDKCFHSKRVRFYVRKLSYLFILCLYKNKGIKDENSTTNSPISKSIICKCS